jgi:hypothetical protein
VEVMVECLTEADVVVECLMVTAAEFLLSQAVAVFQVHLALVVVVAYQVTLSKSVVNITALLLAAADLARLSARVSFKFQMLSIVLR